MKVLNVPNNNLKINEYLLDSLENCEQIEDFCRNCCRVLSDYIEIKNFIIYEEQSQNVNLIYQHNLQHLYSAIDYSEVIQLITQKYISINQGYIYVKDNINYFAQTVYDKWLVNEEIDCLYLCGLTFKNKSLANVFIEIQRFKYPEKEVNSILTLINKYLAIYCYHKQLEKQEHELIIEAEKLIESKEQQSVYLSHMNHELRTPIAAVTGFAKMLQQRLYGELNIKQAQYVDAIYQSGTYLLELVSDLLDVSKIQAQKEELLKEKTLVKELCESALALVKTKAQEQELALNLVIEPDIEYCLVDSRRLKQVLVNLLSNAVKFTEEGVVTLEVSQDNDYTLFKVIDTGIGIDEQSQKKLFQPFSQLNTPLHRKHKGTGLGLVISRELTRLHGGDSILTSVPNQGSCFTVSIPHQ